VPGVPFWPEAPLAANTVFPVKRRPSLQSVKWTAYELSPVVEALIP
jgi:hypothetical protein